MGRIANRITPWGLCTFPTIEVEPRRVAHWWNRHSSSFPARRELASFTIDIAVQQSGYNCGLAG